MFVNSCFIFHFSFVCVCVPGAEMDRLWQEANVCVSTETLGNTKTSRVSAELQTNPPTNAKI